LPPHAFFVTPEPLFIVLPNPFFLSLRSPFLSPRAPFCHPNPFSVTPNPFFIATPNEVRGLPFSLSLPLFYCHLFYCRPFFYCRPERSEGFFPLGTPSRTKRGMHGLRSAGQGRVVPPSPFSITPNEVRGLPFSLSLPHGDFSLRSKRQGDAWTPSRTK
jgi:hypothetical protein